MFQKLCCTLPNRELVSTGGYQVYQFSRTRVQTLNDTYCVSFGRHHETVMTFAQQNIKWCVVLCFRKMTDLVSFL